MPSRQYKLSEGTVPMMKPVAKDEKKQLPLRLSNKLYAELAEWADDEFRSVNGQIEYLLTECVKKQRRK